VLVEVDFELVVGFAVVVLFEVVDGLAVVVEVVFAVVVDVVFAVVVTVVFAIVFVVVEVAVPYPAIFDTVGEYVPAKVNAYWIIDERSELDKSLLAILSPFSNIVSSFKCRTAALSRLPMGDAIDD
jgi:hypothetical protein